MFLDTSQKMSSPQKSSCKASPLSPTMTLWEDHRDPAARLPMFLLQMFVVLVVTRFLGWAIKRLYQPKVRAGVLAGVAVVCVSGLGTPSREVCPPWGDRFDALKPSADRDAAALRDLLFIPAPLSSMTLFGLCLAM